ncbi:MAG: Fic family protein [Solirubrobacteraceae bacterium]
MYVTPAPSLNELVADLGGESLSRAVSAPPAAGYVHWDKLRHLEPPEGVSHREWWLATKLARRPLRRELPLKDADGAPFAYAVPDEAFRLLHYVDQRCSGEIAMAEVVTADDQARGHYLVNSLMEEAIRSSQLEGATTSRRVAKELLRSHRVPTDRSERMILNNYRGLQFMREMGDELSPGLVLELHRILTEGTLDNPDSAGRLQRHDEERVAVFDRLTGDPVHTPPPADQLPRRLDALCDFANRREDDEEQFIHPVVRAILVHFWVGYDHPFKDGNGRLARALFYWCMRTRGYWLTEYLSISRILRDAPAQYTRSFVLTETDERDTTYFLLYHLQVIRRAVEELHDYLQRKIDEVRSVERLVRGSTHFNHRQLALLGHAVRESGHAYTMDGHAGSHGVTHETARTDLADLTAKGLLTRRRQGRRFIFLPASDIVDRLRELE